MFGFADEYSADDLDDMEHLLIKLYKLKDEEDLIIAKAIVSIKILRTIFSIYAGCERPKLKIARKSKYTIILYKHSDNEELLKDYFGFRAIAFANNSIILEAQHNYSLSKSFAFDDTELDNEINFFEKLYEKFLLNKEGITVEQVNKKA